MNDDNSSEASAALELLQIKHRKPSREDCRATSDLLLAIFQFQHTTDADSPHRHWVIMTTTGHRPSAAALLPAGNDDDAAHKYADAPRVVPGSFDLPMPIAHAHDERYLSPLQCYIRKTCLEYFAATASNVTTKGRQTLVSEGRVGVRCSFCKYLPRGQQAAQASEITRIFFPSLLTFMRVLFSFRVISISHFLNTSQRLFRIKSRPSIPP